MDKHALKTLEYDKIIDELQNSARTAPGKLLCAELLPVSDLSRVLARQAETDDAVKLIMEKGSLPLQGISDIQPSISRSVSGAVLGCAELLRIGAFVRAIHRLVAFLPEDYERERPMFNLLAGLQPQRHLHKRLDEAIAGEDELHDQASPALASLRRRIRDAQAGVKERLNQIVRSQAKILQEQLVTMRGDRYVVPVRAEHRGSIPGIVHDTSSSGATLFIEPLPVVEMNNHIRELMGLEREEIERILQELSALVAGQHDILAENLRLAARLDFIQARGNLALAMKAMPPRVNDQGRIRFKAARHPLIPPDRVVPIDFELGFEFNTLIITGPNTGGKTVSLKTCGLFCLMAMAGLQIPVADGSEISIFSQVLADIGDEQSIEQNLSTFSSHMRNIVTITRQAGPDTLVLTDELGSGTDPSEGAALAMAVLDYLREKGCHTVATTHYKELKGYALRTPGVENACCEFDNRSLQPTYRLLIGVPGVSNAFVISGRLGLDTRLIARAKTLVSEDGLRFEEMVASLEQRSREIDALKQETDKTYAYIRENREKLESEQKKLAEQKRQIIHQAREEARDYYLQAQREIDGLLAEIREQKHREELELSEKAAIRIRQNIRAGLSGVEARIGTETLAVSGPQASPEEIVTGNVYLAPALGLEGKVVAGPDNRGNYTLQSDGMKVSVPASALRLPEPATSAAKKRNRLRPVPGGGRKKLQQKSLRLNIQSEIKLLGQTVDEAMSSLDKYLDDCVLAGMTQIRIVHGKGTGALRSAVTQKLKQDKRVKSFRLGAYGEGDSGVTLAELN